MKFEIWTVDGATGRTVRKLGTTSSWPLANFVARLGSLMGDSLIVGEGVFEGEAPGDKTPLASYHRGLLERFYAGAPAAPSIWP